MTHLEKTIHKLKAQIHEKEKVIDRLGRSLEVIAER